MRTKFRKMFLALAFCLSGLVALMIGLLANAQDVPPEVEKILVLKPNGFPGGIFGDSLQAGVVHISVEEGHTTLRFSLTGLTPNAVHSVWMGLDSGANPCGGAGQPACLAPFISCNGPQCTALNPGTGTNGDIVNVFSFSPAAADDAGFTAGNGLDPNGFFTDAGGNAEFKINLNYDIFAPAVAPMVLRPPQAQNLAVAFDAAGTTCFSSPGAAFPGRVDSAYARVYDTSTVANLPAISPSYQLRDAPLKPRLLRTGVSGLGIVEHFDGLTHGHVPGFNTGNPMASSCGDNGDRLMGNLANAVLEN